MLRTIKKAIRLSIYHITVGINTIYYLLIPKNKKIVVDGFFTRILGYTRKNNLGDDLNFYILAALSNKKIFSAPNLLIKCPNILFIGSILQKYINNDSIIWGAGTIDEYAFPTSRPHLIKAVRGPLTRQWLIKNNIDCPTVYSDPALLLPLIYRPKIKKVYKYGIIPHYVDWNSNGVEYLSKILGDSNIKMINMAEYKSCESVINEIIQCEYVISSSLHGIIISDAYNIPNIWVEFSNNVYGNGFKFRDYFLSVNRQDKNPLKVDNKLDSKEIDLCISKYQKPLIDVVPFLQNAPIYISSDLIKEAKMYYTHE